MRLGVYCETLEPGTLAAADTIRLLGERSITLGHALRYGGREPFDSDALSRRLDLAGRLAEAGGEYALWPLLPRHQGYWINERNLDLVDRMADGLLEAFGRHGSRPGLIVFDIETPWSQVERALLPGSPWPVRSAALLAMAFSNRRPGRFRRASVHLDRIVARIRRAGCPVAAAAFPFFPADLAAGRTALQDWLEMPLSPVAFDAVNLMFYTSYLPALAPLLVPPGSAPRALFEYAGLLRQRYGEAAWVTLGSTWEGVLPGNAGRVHRRPADLSADVAAAGAAGIETIWLYCLEGVLFEDAGCASRRPVAESAAWFDVLCLTPPAEPPHHAGWSRGRRLLELAARLL